jgi:hypothetical protein
MAGFASALEAATGLGPRGAAAARSAAEELRVLAAPGQGAPPRLEELTRGLGATEKALLGALRADAAAEALAAIGAEIERDLAPYHGRMPERVLDQIRDEAWTRRLLGRHGIPRLSLFHL